MSAVGTFMWVAVWCSDCDEEWDVLMSPEERSGESEPAGEYVCCPSCDRRGEWSEDDSSWEDNAL